MDQYAVFGNPIAHSKSPDIHTLFAQQTGQQLEYRKQQVREGEFFAAADAFFANAGCGLNVTVPFKLEAFRYASDLTPRAKLAGAVNTLIKTESGSILGDNTDGAGLVNDIVEQLGWPITGRRVLVLGAGGAVRGVIEPLLRQKPESVVIANRTVAKAVDLVNDLDACVSTETVCRGCGFADLAGQQFDLIINATSASLTGDLPPLPDSVITPDTACYDMMYGAEPTVFIRWAQKLGCQRCADGLGMLVGQAAESFYLWRGQKPDVKPVIAAIRDQLAT